MPKFFYIARDASGQKITDSDEAQNADELIDRLHAKELIVINIASEANKDQLSSSSIKGAERSKQQAFKHYGIRNDDLVVFCRQLATLLGAAVTILKSLDTISKQVSSRRLYNVILDMQRNMEAGLSLHETMAKHPKVFSDLWINLVETGEASGNLALILNRLATYLERSAYFRKKMISNLIYPGILMAASVGALLFLTVKIIPTFAEIFKGFNITLPTMTRLLISASFFIRKFLLVGVGIIIAVIVFVIRPYINTKDGRMRYESMKFKLPLFGEFYRALVVERFSSGMSTLIESGIPILYSLEITEHSVGSLIMTDIIRKIKEEVRSGKSLSSTLEESRFFEPMVVQMLAVGEEVGDLPQMFKRINAFYQEYVETFLSRITTIFEPIVLIFMGVVIGFMVIGMFVPIFQIATIGGR